MRVGKIRGGPRERKKRMSDERGESFFYLLARRRRTICENMHCKCIKAQKGIVLFDRYMYADRYLACKSRCSVEKLLRPIFTFDFSSSFIHIARSGKKWYRSFFSPYRLFSYHFVVMILRVLS